MFNCWKWKWLLGGRWAMAIDVSVVLLGLGVTLIVGALIIGRVILPHFIDASTNDFIQVTASYIQRVNASVGSAGAILGLACLAFIIISRVLVRSGWNR
jgi:hypothetical protein